MLTSNSSPAHSLNSFQACPLYLSLNQGSFLKPTPFLKHRGLRKINRTAPFIASFALQAFSSSDSPLRWHYPLGAPFSAIPFTSQGLHGAHGAGVQSFNFKGPLRLAPLLVANLLLTLQGLPLASLRLERLLSQEPLHLLLLYLANRPGARLSRSRQTDHQQCQRKRQGRNERGSTGHRHFHNLISIYESDAVLR
jgi:hypothetical protein